MTLFSLAKTGNNKRWCWCLYDDATIQ